MDGRMMGAINGLNLLDQNEKDEMEGGMAACNWTRRTMKLNK